VYFENFKKSQMPDKQVKPRSIHFYASNKQKKSRKALRPCGLFSWPLVRRKI